jgi:hypothetical protein
MKEHTYTLGIEEEFAIVDPETRDGGGGGIANNGGTLNVTNSTFSGNSASSDGGDTNETKSNPGSSSLLNTWD